MAIGNFNELNVPTLKAVAAQFSVDLETGMKKADILKELSEMGVTAQMYNALLVDTEDEPEAPVELAPLDDTPLEEEEKEPEVDEESSQVLKMTRKNGTYEIRGYKFTRQHPYAIVNDEDAEFLIETGGFRPASKKEIQEFYGL